MTIIAGIIHFNQTNSIGDNEKNELQSSLSRRNNLEDFIFCKKRVFIASKLIHNEDITDCFYEGEESITFLLGNPYMDSSRNGFHCNLRGQLQLLHDMCKQNNWNELKNNCRGVFCIIHYNYKINKLVIISDKLGIWPIYYCFEKERVVFSTALRVLESCSFVPQIFDIRGVSEIATFGFPLADRTPYINIKRNTAGEVIQFEDNNQRKTSYWRWDSIPEIRLADKQSVVEEAFSHFVDAVKLRLSGDSTVISYLSGGLDSRSIVAILLRCGCQVHAFNFSPEKSQDRHFAAEFAEKSDILYKEFAFTKNANWSQMMADAWKEQAGHVVSVPERPQTIWSGDGGSVGTGYVYLNHNIVDAALRGDLDNAIALFVEYNKFHFHGKIINNYYRKKLDNIIEAGIKEEVLRFSNVNQGRALHLFLMENDQRRHLDRHFENLDLHQLDFHLPFFDSFFLQKVFSLPIKYCLNHEFYMDWFQLFPSVTRSVPWQTYPGHKPCGLSNVNELQYQWDKAVRNSDTDIKERKAIVKSFLLECTKQDFPKHLLNRYMMLLVGILQYVNLKNYDYLFRAANIYLDFWHKSSESGQ